MTANLHSYDSVGAAVNVQGSEGGKCVIGGVDRAELGENFILVVVD